MKKIFFILILFLFSSSTSMSLDNKTTNCNTIYPICAGFLSAGIQTLIIVSLKKQELLFNKKIVNPKNYLCWLTLNIIPLLAPYLSHCDYQSLPIKIFIILPAMGAILNISNIFYSELLDNKFIQEIKSKEDPKELLLKFSYKLLPKLNCQICLEKIRKENIIVTCVSFKYVHAYCVQCLKNWFIASQSYKEELQQEFSCPACFKKLSEENDIVSISKIKHKFNLSFKKEKLPDLALYTVIIAFYVIIIYSELIENIF